MARRGHGEGSIYQRKDGRWAASITLENRKRKTFYGKTRKEVQEQLKKALHEQQQGKLAIGSKQTVEQFFNHWLEDVHKASIRHGSYDKYRTLLDKHIFPSIGHVQLSKLTAQQVQAFYARLLKDGFSASTVQTIHALLHKGLDQAVKWKLVAENVTDGITLPRRPANYEMRTLTSEQAQRLLEVAKGHQLEALLTVALATGMRRGELLSLRWKDIDFATRSLQVRRTVSYKNGYGLEENEPKTVRSKRKIILPQFVIDALKQHRVRQLEERLKVGEAWIDRDLVFCNATGNYLAFSNLFYMFQALLEEAGLPQIRFHDVRRFGDCRIAPKGQKVRATTF